MPLFSNPVTLIYLDECALKIAVSKQSEGDVASVYYAQVLNMSESQIISEIIRGLETTKASKDNVRLIVSSEYAVTKMIEVPSFDQSEITQIVNLQAGRHSPLSRDEITVSHIQLETVASKYTKVLLSILTNSKISKQSDLVSAAGCQVQGVHASFDVVAHGLARSKSIVASDYTGIVLIDAGHTDFIVAHSGKPIFVRTMAIGAGGSMQPSEQAELLNEIVKSHESYTAVEGDKPLDKILVLGPNGSEIQGLAQTINEKLFIPTQILNVSEKTHLNSEAKSNLAMTHGSPLDNILLAASVTATELMDFLPTSLKTQMEFKKKAQSTFYTAMCMLVIFMCGIGVFVSEIYFKSAYITKLEQKFAARNSEALELIQKSNANKMISEFKNAKGDAIRVLLELERILPPEMYLNEVDLDAEGKIAIRGTSQLMSRVFAFVSEFENSELFSNIITDFAKSRKLEDRDVTDFGLTASIEKGGNYGR